MSRTDGALSAAYWNGIHDELVAWAKETMESLREQYTADGYPPFHVPLEPREQYDLLGAWRAAGDPRYWGDPAAPKALERLALRFGPPPPIPQDPYRVGGLV